VTISVPTVIIFVLAIGLLVALYFIVRLENRLKRFWRGKKGADLESVVMELADNIEILHRNASEVGKQLTAVDQRLKQAVSKVHTIRFNPYGDQGGNHSFATAFVNDSGDGVVISGLYARDRVNVYAKPLSGGNSEHELTNEEKQAIRTAKK
jgi:hypothetical protein